MDDPAFYQGKIEYQAGYHDPSEIGLDPAQWDDGFVAFSRGEVRLNAITGTIGRLPSFDAPLETPADDGGFGGYIVEVNVWRHRDGAHEELVLERENHQFYRQNFRLTPGDGADWNCYYRPATTTALGHTLFQGAELPTIEVIWPDHRLHFFITTGGKDS